MRVDVITNEYPPSIYGGAGVHVTELVKALRQSIEVHVRCFGEERDEELAFGYQSDAALDGANAALATMSRNLRCAPDVSGADLVHSHTWYANFGGHLASLLHGIPHIMTSHSLEPLRPWKADQLGGGYALSSFVEKTAVENAAAVIAVSHAMRDDILRSYPAVDPACVETIHNGIDTAVWYPSDAPDVVRQLGLNPDKPLVTFVGRITRQKGLPYLLKALRQLPTDTQVLLCAGAPDTEAIAKEVEGLVSDLNATHPHVVWEQRHLPVDELRSVLTHTDVFVCPSIYEPLGIVNLEAMACGAAVVATATGGIPEVVVDGSTGWLVPIEQVTDGSGTPVDETTFVTDLANTLTEALSDTSETTVRGKRGLDRAAESFTWDAIATQTKDLYHRVLSDFSR